MANLARFLLTSALTSLVVREVYSISSDHLFIKFVRDGVEYADICSVPLPSDVTVLTAALASGHYNTITWTPGTTINDEPTASAATLV